ncbi:hypothetical protein [Rurimicrobium arvi]|uniref:Water stress and hypersensitive response domain-containing protein n=1 Tax=Rurimicrobium arvi TaxID=2049916 RepID=A0ABP8MZG2_9BACT
MHPAVKIGIGVGAFLIVNRMLQLNKLVANVTVALSKVRVHKVNLSGIEIAVTAKINNPSNVSVTIVNPVVRLWDSKGNMIAESPATGKSFPIAANRQSEVGEIMLPVGWTAVLPLMGVKNITSLVQLFSKNGTTGLLHAFSSPVAMTVIMQVDGMTLETPKTVINK